MKCRSPKEEKDPRPPSPSGQTLLEPQDQVVAGSVEVTRLHRESAVGNSSPVGDIPQLGVEPLSRAVVPIEANPQPYFPVALEARHSLEIHDQLPADAVVPVRRRHQQVVDL